VIKHTKPYLPCSRKNRGAIPANSPIPLRPQQAGFTLLELLICLALSTVIILGLSDILATTLATRSIVRAENDTALQAEFAMDRMLRMVSTSRRLLLPLGENPATAWSESVRDVLAVTLPVTIDLDNNGIPDADNDGDGRIDEDLGDDNTNDDKSGIIGIDDNNNGAVDERGKNDNDEDGHDNDDYIDGLDNDNDGSIDEDIDKDMNKDGKSGIKGADDDGDGSIDEESNEDDDEDGVKNEDWFDPVVYFLANGILVERLPVPWDENGADGLTGADFIENPLAENVTRFEVTWLASGSNRPVLVTILLELAGPDGEPYALTATARLGGGL
jgi:prepilin-type N-terminal cleavage/methylation domain-containing protein